MSIIIEDTIGHLREPFVIKQDGSSQTMVSNRGRVGFHVEKLFGIAPNKSREPDFKGCELKTTQPGKKISISTMSDLEFRHIKDRSDHMFEQSSPYHKMKNTLVVVYTKLKDWPEPTYIMNGWGFLSLNKIDESMKYVLQSDYEYICKIIATKCKSRDGVTQYLRQYGMISGKYLCLGYKGRGDYGYNYPAWNFQSSFMKTLIHA